MGRQTQKLKYLFRQQGRRNRGSQGGHWPPQIFRNSLKWRFDKCSSCLKSISDGPPRFLDLPPALGRMSPKFLYMYVMFPFPLLTMRSSCFRHDDNGQRISGSFFTIDLIESICRLLGLLKTKQISNDFAIVHRIRLKFLIMITSIFDGSLFLEIC